MKKSPNIIISALSGLLLLSVVSCVDDFKVGDAFLEKAPSVDVDQDSIFNDPNHARGFLWNAYTSLYFGLPMDWGNNKMGMGAVDALTDNFHSGLSWDGVRGMYYPGQFNSTSGDANSIYSYTNGEGQWTGIRKAYLFLQNIDRTPRIDENEKTRLKAEAKMIIACHYFDMFHNFGGLPLVTKAFNTDDDFKIPRSTALETMNFITKLCDEAYAVLPWALPAEEVEQWSGRFTAAGALGLKIKTLTFGASPLFNNDAPYHTKPSAAIEQKHVWFGKYDQCHWDSVVVACDKFITRNRAEGEPYKLVKKGNPKQDFQDAYYVRNNGELIIDTRRRGTVSWFWDQNMYYLQSYGAYGAITPTLDYTDCFNNADGTPFDASFWDRQSKDTYTDIDPFANRDPRLYETCIVNNMPYIDRKAEMFLAGRERGASEDQPTRDGGGFTGAAIYKFILDRGSMANKQSQWPYLRLPEIYLSYAEALNEVGRTTDAYQWVDIVRDRVKLGGLQLGLDKKGMLKEILRERSCEFGGEEVRYYDMTRRKLANDFRKRLRGVDIRRETTGEGDDKKPTGRFSYEVFNIDKRFIQDSDDGKVNFDPKWYLCPFPFQEMMKGYLTQNPGW